MSQLSQITIGLVGLVEIGLGTGMIELRQPIVVAPLTPRHGEHGLARFFHIIFVQLRGLRVAIAL